MNAHLLKSICIIRVHPQNKRVSEITVGWSCTGRQVYFLRDVKLNNVQMCLWSNYYFLIFLKNKTLNMNFNTGNTAVYICIHFKN